MAERLLERAADFGIEAAVVRADHGDVLLLAGRDAATAEDALRVVALEVQRGVILLARRHRALEAVLVVDAHVVAELLQLAGAASLAGEALGGHGRRAAAPASFFWTSGTFGVLVNTSHAFVYGIYARGDERTRALNLDHAHAACADLVDVLQEAKGRNVDSGLSGSFKDRAAGRHFAGHAVDLDVYHIHCIHTPSLFLLDCAELALFTADTALDALLRVDDVRLADGAGDRADRQLRAQSVQPLHFSASMT